MQVVLQFAQSTSPAQRVEDLDCTVPVMYWPELQDWDSAVHHIHFDVSTVFSLRVGKVEKKRKAEEEAEAEAEEEAEE